MKKRKGERLEKIRDGMRGIGEVVSGYCLGGKGWWERICIVAGGECLKNQPSFPFLTFNY